MASKNSKRCRKCGEKLYFHQCRCFRCRAVNPVPMTLLAGFVILCNAAVGYLLAMMMWG